MESRTTQHQEETKRNYRHIPEVERRLEQSIHSTSMEIVEEGIRIDKDTSHTGIDKDTPPPSVIFSGQLEVKQGYTDKGSHDEKENECEEQNSKQGIHLMSPHGSEDIMQLNVNCRKG